MNKIIVFLIIFCLVGLGIYTAWRTHNGSTDFDTYYYAAKRIINSEPVYLEIKGLSPYIYPPFFACLITPLILFPMELAAFVWYLMNLLFFILSLMFSITLIFGSKNIRNIWEGVRLLPKIIFLLVTGAIFIDNITLLQVNILLFFAVTAGLYFFTRRRFNIGGVLFAAAISIKITPVLFLFYFIIKKEFKMAYIIILWIVLFTLVVPTLFLGLNKTQEALMIWNDSTFNRSISSVSNFQMMAGMFNPVNQSITATLSRWIIKNDNDIIFWKTACYKYPAFLMNQSAFLTRNTVLFISHIVAYVLVGISLLCCIRRKKDNAPICINYESSLIFLASLLLNPILKTPHFIFIIFPFFFLISRLRSEHEDYPPFPLGFIIAGILYLFLAIKFFRIIGTGTISIFILWLLVLRQRHKVCKDSLA